VLAALLVEAEAGADTARRVARRLDLGDEAEDDVALLVGESTLLRAAAARHDGLREDRVLPIAAHLERPERAAALFLLSLALGPLPPAQRGRLEALAELVQSALARPDPAGVEGRGLARQRLAEACREAGEGTAAAERLEHAPQAWLLAHGPAELARMAALVEPLPFRGDVRVAVVPAGARCWRVEVACRDERGLLAVLTAALAAAGLEVADASIAGWPDGGVADSFTVRSGEGPPDPAELRRRIDAARRRPSPAPPVPDAAVTFDDEASPWHTLCTVEAADRPGLLHTLAVAFAACGADVHAARVTTDAGVARDSFHLTDARGAKLSPGTEEAIRRAVLGGPPGPRLARARLGRPGRRPSPAADVDGPAGLEDLAPDGA
jgi:UTP:GlnB (protein PII) uridylyltransferase